MGLSNRPRVRFGEGDVVQLRIELDGLAPPVWRQVLVSARASLHELHRVIQAVMGHEEELGYQVEIDGVSFLDPDEETRTRHRADGIALDALGLRPGHRFRHVAEHHGEPWVHVLTVEQVTPRLIGQRLPACLAAGRASPPSDCSGIDEYRQLVAALAEPADIYAAAQLHWLPEHFDPEFADVVSLNAELNRMPMHRPVA